MRFPVFSGVADILKEGLVWVSTQPSSLIAVPAASKAYSLLIKDNHINFIRLPLPYTDGGNIFVFWQNNSYRYGWIFMKFGNIIGYRPGKAGLNSGDDWPGLGPSLLPHTYLLPIGNDNVPITV